MRVGGAELERERERERREILVETGDLVGDGRFGGRREIWWETGDFGGRREIWWEMDQTVWQRDLDPSYVVAKG